MLRNVLERGAPVFHLRVLQLTWAERAAVSPLTFDVCREEEEAPFIEI